MLFAVPQNWGISDCAFVYDSGQCGDGPAEPDPQALPGVPGVVQPGGHPAPGVRLPLHQASPAAGGQPPLAAQRRGTAIPRSRCYQPGWPCYFGIPFKAIELRLPEPSRWSGVTPN